jgi:hypothetical protein
MHICVLHLKMDGYPDDSQVFAVLLHSFSLAVPGHQPIEVVGPRDDAGSRTTHPTVSLRRRR